jgi:chromosomal replication initiation ATPase DnaA
LTEPDKNLPALKQITGKPTIEKISREVAAVFKDDALVSRTVKLYLCQRYTGLQLRVIGEYFGIGESGVCQASRRLDLKMKGDSGLQKKVDKIKGKLWLSRMKT